MGDGLAPLGTSVRIRQRAEELKAYAERSGWTRKELIDACFHIVVEELAKLSLEDRYETVEVMLMSADDLAACRELKGGGM